jgi:hypothetical protein
MEQMRLALLANMSGTPSHDGQVIALTLNLKGGVSHSAAIAANQMAGAIGFMMSLAQKASDLRPGHASEPPQKVPTFSISHLAFAKGKTENDVVLSMQVGPMELSFEVPKTTLLQSLARLQAPAPAPAKAAPAAKAAAAAPAAAPKPPAKPLPPRTGISAPKAGAPKPKILPKPTKR